MANRIDLRIQAKTAGAAGVQKLQGQMKLLKSQTSGLQGAFGKLRGITTALVPGLGALGAAAGAVGLAAAARQTLDYVDKLGKLSTQTGLAAGELQGLERVFKTAGFGAGDVAKIFRRMTPKIIAAANGARSNAQAFRKLGVEVVDAEGKLRPTREVFLDVADAMSKTEDGSEKLAIAQRTVGVKMGPELIPLLNLGREGLLRYSTTLDQDAVRATEKLNDTIAELGHGFQDFKVNSVLTLVGPVQDLIDEFRKLFQNSRRQWPNFSRDAEKALRIVGAGLLAVAQAVDFGIRNLATLYGALERLGSGDIDGALRRIRERVAEIGAEAEGSLAAFNRLRTGVGEQFATNIKDANAELATTTKELGSVRRQLNELNESEGDHIGEIAKLRAQETKLLQQQQAQKANLVTLGQEQAALTGENLTGEDEVVSLLKEQKAEKAAAAAAETADEKRRREARARFEQHQKRIRSGSAQILKTLEQRNLVREAGIIGEQKYNEEVKEQNKALEEQRRKIAEIKALAKEGFFERQKLIEQERFLQNESYEATITEEKRLGDVRKQQAEETIQRIEDIRERLSSGIADAIKGLIRGTETWSNLLSNIANKILDAIIDKLVQAVVAGKGLGGAISSLFGGGGAGGGAGNLLSLSGLAKGAGNLLGIGAGGAAAAAGAGITSAQAASLGIGQAAATSTAAAGAGTAATGGAASALASVAKLAGPLAIAGGAIYAFSKIFGGGGEPPLPPGGFASYHSGLDFSNFAYEDQKTADSLQQRILATRQRTLGFRRNTDEIRADAKEQLPILREQLQDLWEQQRPTSEATQKSTAAMEQEIRGLRQETKETHRSIEASLRTPRVINFQIETTLSEDQLRDFINDQKRPGGALYAAV